MKAATGQREANSQWKSEFGFQSRGAGSLKGADAQLGSFIFVWWVEFIQQALLMLIRLGILLWLLTAMATCSSLSAGHFHPVFQTLSSLLQRSVSVGITFLIYMFV